MLSSYTTKGQVLEQFFVPQITEQLSLTVEETAFIEQVNDRTFIADVQLVSLGNIFDFQENGYVRFLFLQDGIHNILVETLDIQYEAADNYRYKGIVLDDEGLSIGELIINRLPQGFSGDFRFLDQAYEMIHLREDLNLLVKRQIPTEDDLFSCGLDTRQASPSNNSTSSCPDTTFDPVEVICEEGNPKCYASPKILLLITPDAKRDIGASDLELFITNLVERTNYALERSKANTTVHFVFEDNFEWEKNSDFIKEDALALSNYDIAINLRNQHNADLVIMLTDTYNLHFAVLKKKLRIKWKV